MNCLTVATECPSCGAPLDFTEGTNALKCLHCQSNLLVTGRKQVLSYLVAPRLDERLAPALAIKAWRDLGQREFKEVRSRLYYIPYYRLTGQDLTWEKGREEETPDNWGTDDQDAGESGHLMSESYDDFRLEAGGPLFRAAGEVFGKIADRVFNRKEETTEERPPTPAPSEQTEKLLSGYSGEIQRHAGDRHEKKAGRYVNGEVDLHDRYQEKNFLACELHGLGLYSLGVRPSVLKLQLFRKETVGISAVAVRPSLDPGSAEAIGIRTALNKDELCRRVVGRVLSIVYFPFWVVDVDNRGKRSLAIIDAVSKTVIKADAPDTLYHILDREMEEVPDVAGFRPLICPNCGWDLPVRPDDCVFFCSNCKKAWQIDGSLLNEVPFRVAEVPGLEKDKNIRHLPFWVFRAGEREGRPFHLFAPAFRYRRLRFLMDMALSFTRLQPSYGFSGPEDEELSGCYYDREDGLIIAGFAHAGITAKNADEFKNSCGEDLPFSEAVLTWIPFRVEGNYLVAPFGIMSLPKNLLL